MIVWRGHQAYIWDIPHSKRPICLLNYRIIIYRSSSFSQKDHSELLKRTSLLIQLFQLQRHSKENHTQRFISSTDSLLKPSKTENMFLEHIVICSLICCQERPLVYFFSEKTTRIKERSVIRMFPLSIREKNMLRTCLPCPRHNWRFPSNPSLGIGHLDSISNLNHWYSPVVFSYLLGWFVEGKLSSRNWHDLSAYLAMCFKIVQPQ